MLVDTLAQKRNILTLCETGYNELYDPTQSQRDRKYNFFMHPKTEDLDMIKKHMDDGYVVLL